jgi:hypothetical protein
MDDGVMSRAIVIAILQIMLLFVSKNTYNMKEYSRK